MTIIRAFLAAAALAGILVLAGTTDLSAAQWAIGSLAGVAAYVGVLHLTGALPFSELRSVLRLPMRALRRV
jgi:hypothetical protein